MKRTVVLIILICIIAGAIMSCTKREQKQEVAKNAVRIILKHYSSEDPNPLYRDEAKKLNDLFRYALINRSILNETERETIRKKAEALCKKSKDGEQAGEDAVDERRILLKKSMCMSTAALVAPSRETLKLYKDARSTMENTADGTVHELLEEEYASIVLLELLFLSENGLLKTENRNTAVDQMHTLGSLPMKERESFLEAIRTL